MFSLQNIHNSAAPSSSTVYQGACGKIHCGLSAWLLLRFYVILCSRVSIADITDCVIMYCSPYFCLFLFFSRFNPHSLLFTPAVQVLHLLSTNLHFLPIPVSAFHPEVIRSNRSPLTGSKVPLVPKKGTQYMDAYFKISETEQRPKSQYIQTISLHISILKKDSQH